MLNYEITIVASFRTSCVGRSSNPKYTKERNFYSKRDFNRYFVDKFKNCEV